MTEREVVECNHDQACGSLGPDHHGWGCPLSDPMGDLLRHATDEPMTNPILAGVQREYVERMLGASGDTDIRSIADNPEG